MGVMEGFSNVTTTIPAGRCPVQVVTGAMLVTGVVGGAVAISGVTVTTASSLDATATGLVVVVKGGSVALAGPTVTTATVLDATATGLVAVVKGGTIAITGPVAITGGPIPGNGGQLLMTVASTSVIATNTTQFMLMSVLFDQYTTSQLVSGYTVQKPIAVTGITMVYSGTSVTALSVFLGLYATTSGVSLTSNAVVMWTTVFPTFTGAAVLTTLNFPNTVLLPGGGVFGLAVYRSASATITLNIAFSITGQFRD